MKGVPKLPVNKIVHLLMEDNNPEAAVAMVLHIKAGLRPLQIRQAFETVRARILANDLYKISNAADLFNQLFQDFPEICERDRGLLGELAVGSLRQLRFAQIQYAPFRSVELNKAFKNLKFVKDPYYEFKTPENITFKAVEDVRQRVHDKHQHKIRKTTAAYHFTEEEIDGMIRVATDYCNADHDWTVKANSLRLVEALGLLTGRRRWEIISTLKIRTVPDNSFQAEVSGLCKRFQDDLWYKIPLLAPIDVIIKGLCKVRQCTLHVKGKYTSVKMFPRLNHTAYRDLYTKRAYRDRHINKFHQDSCSEMWWGSMALQTCLQAYSERYSTMVVDKKVEEDNLS